jgi:hypothetical protein
MQAGTKILYVRGMRTSSVKFLNKEAEQRGQSMASLLETFVKELKI